MVWSLDFTQRPTGRLGTEKIRRPTGILTTLILTATQEVGSGGGGGEMLLQQSLGL